MNYIGLVVTILILGLIIGAYLIWKNSPFGQAVGSILGAFETAVEGIAKQLELCEQDGIFSGQCPYGFFIVGAVIIVGLYRVISFFGLRGFFQSNTAKEFNRAFERDATADDLQAAQNDANDWADKWETNKNFNEDEQIEIVKAITDANFQVKIQNRLKLDGKTLGASTQDASNARARYDIGTPAREAFDAYAEENDLEFAE